MNVCALVCVYILVLQNDDKPTDTVYYITNTLFCINNYEYRTKC
jgi:hypothetical protein